MCLLCVIPVLGYAQYSVDFINGYQVNIDGTLYPSGMIRDDGGVNQYSSGVDAVIVISGRAGDTVLLQGNYYTESGYDKLTVFEGSDMSGAILGEYSGSGTLSLISHTGFMTLVWHTDGSVTFDGFELYYSVLPNRCTNAVFQFYAGDVGATWARMMWEAADTSESFLLHWADHDSVVSGSSCRVEGLHPDSSYLFTLSSVNDTSDSSCRQSSLVNTTCFPAIINGVRPICGNDIVTLTADSADAYLWSTGDTARSISVSDSGWYSLVAFTHGGCTDTTEVKVGGIRLNMDITMPTSLCPGDSASVLVGMSASATVRVLRNKSTLSEAGRIFLPDGQYCDPNGCSYRSELNFSGFAHDAHISSVNDIRYVMLNIEHSFIGDIYINITCPNNQSADLLKYGGSGSSYCNSSITAASRGWSAGSNLSGGTYLGAAADGEGSSYCDSTDPGNAPGVGWRYCWSNCVDAGYSYSAGDGLMYRSWNYNNGSVDSSNVSAGTNFYHPDEPLTSLIGCPMNGIWYIEVIDGWSSDNGYIFGWELALNPNRLSRDEYVPTVAYADLFGPYAERRSDTAFTIIAPLDLSHDTAVTYTVTITDSLGCMFDTIFTILFRSASITNVYDTVTEDALPRRYAGRQFASDTVYNFHFPGDAGCDSLVVYHLHVLRNTQAALDTTVCADALPLLWHSLIFTDTGTSSFHTVNHAGADSLVTLTVHVNPVYAFTQTATTCSNQPYSFDGSEYTATGVYPHSYLTADGCDSVRTLDLTVFSITHSDTLANECDQFVWRGIAFTASDTMTALASSPNAAGCDSTVTLHLTIRHSTSSAVFDTVFENDLPHIFNGTAFTADTSNMPFTLANSQGCDSNISYSLHVLRNSYAVFDTSFCADRLPLQWYHRIFYTAGTQHDTLVNHVGADSLLTLTLGVWPVYHDTVPASICDNQSYSFEGQSYTAAGHYPHIFSTAHGCDSVRTLSLTVRSTTHGDTLANECDQFVWHGNAFTASDTMTALAATPNAAGCDSTVTLHLTIRHSTDSSFIIESCDSYDWHGTTYLAPPTGVPTHTIANSVGCDSVMRLASLVLHYRQHLYDTAAICENQLLSGYAWRDTAFSSGTASGSYAITRPDQYGCDSIMHLSLTVRTNTAGTQYDTIVENQASSWQYHGTPVSSDTSLSITIANQWGCDSVVAYHLFVWPNVATMADTHICDNRTADFSWYGQPYADTLVTVLADQHGADSTVTLVVHLDSTFHRDIYDTICADQSVAFGGRDYSHSGDYEHTFPSQQLCDSVVTLHLTVHPTFSLDLYDTVYVGDTIVFDGIYEFVEPGDYPIHYLTEHGCDSLVTLHIAGRNLLFIHRADSICEGDTLYFAGNPLTAPGTYIDTVLSGSFISGDTIVELELSVLQRPDISIKREYVCDAPAHYVLTGRTDAPYLNWLGYGVTEGHEHDSIIAILNPPDTALVTLYVDYAERPICPTTLDMGLSPIAVVQALIDVRPTAMTLEERHVTATNVSSGPVQSHRWYVFYNDDLPFTDTARRLSLQVPMFVDSLLLVLEVSSDMCRDNDSVLVDVLRSDILFPNVFTPSLSTNNRFHAYTTAVTEFELWIYDRRGDLMFHTTDIDEAWDGTSGGTVCPQGSYVYKCRYRDEVTPSGYQTVTGTVTLLR